MLRSFGRAARGAVSLPCGCRFGPDRIEAFCGEGRRLWRARVTAERALRREEDAAARPARRAALQAAEGAWEAHVAGADPAVEFSRRERAWLAFYRWLVETGRVTEGAVHV